MPACRPSQSQVLSSVEPGYLRKLLPTEAPEDPEPWEDVQKDFDEKIMPGITHWQHPMFCAFFPANFSFPALLGDMYSGMINCIGFNWQTSPSCTELETIVLDWMAKLVGLDPCFLSTSGTGGGCLQGSASEGIIVAMLAARHRVLDHYRALYRKKRAEKRGVTNGVTNGNGLENGAHDAEEEADDEEKEEIARVAGKLVAYVSSETHSSTTKAALIANVRCHRIKTSAKNKYSLQGSELRHAIEEDIAKGLIPFFITGTIGTTSSGAVDDIPGICDAGM
ncbi:hypothetical protein HK102_011372 [Quaeritorhiza haematococci]|nr:hypothetical protein HK102_011372 [Quaeritorhiza haematococci]